jgi:hypothetical protein
VLEKSHSIYVKEDLVMVNEHQHTSITCNLSTMTLPLAIAQQNEQEFVVESINGHRGNRQRRSTMEFKVRWAGFGESCDSREPYKALLHVDKLHDYLRANAMKTLIPSEHK